MCSLWSLVLLSKGCCLMFSTLTITFWFHLGTDFLLAPMRRFSWVPSLQLFKSPETWLSQRPRCWLRTIYCNSQAQPWLENRGLGYGTNCCPGSGEKAIITPTLGKLFQAWVGRRNKSTVFVAVWSRNVQNNFIYDCLIDCPLCFTGRKKQTPLIQP